jgi:hypothetical protein
VTIATNTDLAGIRDPRLAFHPELNSWTCSFALESSSFFSI